MRAGRYKEEAERCGLLSRCRAAVVITRVEISLDIMLDEESVMTWPAFCYPGLYSPPRVGGKRKREEEEERGASPDQWVPTVHRREDEKEGAARPDLPFSSLMRRMAARYQPSPSPLPSSLHLPILSSPLHLAPNPYSRLMASLASSHSSLSSPPSPPSSLSSLSPPLKRRREEGPIDLSSTSGGEEDLLDVVSVEKEQEEEQKQEQEEQEQEQEQGRARVARLLQELGGGHRLVRMAVGRRGH